MPRDAAGEPLLGGLARLHTAAGSETWVFYADDCTVEEIDDCSMWAEAHSFGEPLSRTAFVEDVLYRVGFKQRCVLGGWAPQTDWGRLGVDWGDARGFFRGGYSIIPHTTTEGEAIEKHKVLRNGEIEDRFRPRYAIRSIDAVRALMGSIAPDHADPPDRGGVRGFFSVRALVEAQAGKPLKFAEACDLYGVDLPEDAPGFDGLLSELDAVEALYVEAMRLHRKLSPHRPPTAAISSGSYAQALFEQHIGLEPPLGRQPRFRREVLSGFMAAFFAGDVGLGARGPEVPVRFLDMAGAYAMAAIHSGVYELLAARRVHTYSRDPTHVTAYLARVARKLRRWLDGKGPFPLTPRDWRRLARTLVWVKPNGDILPHRIQIGESWRMTVAPLTSDEPLPFVLADVLASLLRTGQIPTITRALRIAPWGTQPQQPATLPTGTAIEPGDDPFEVMANERARLETVPGSDLLRGLLKGIINSMASGKPSQINDDEATGKKRPTLVWDHTLNPEPETIRSHVQEEPGAWYFPPAAAGVTATARLLLTISRVAFESAGGTIAYWDTDSLLVIATPHGGVIPMPGGDLRTEDGEPAVRALSYPEVEAVRWRLEELSPYPPELRPTINVWDPDTDLPAVVQTPRFLRIEPENYQPLAAGWNSQGLDASVTSAKRYDAYFVDRPGGHIELRDGYPVVVEPTAEQTRNLSAILVRAASHHGATQLPPSGIDDWVEQGVAVHLALQHGLRIDEPAFLGEPALSLIPVTRPAIGRALDSRPFSRIASWGATFTPRTAITPYHRSLDPMTASWRDAVERQPLSPVDTGSGTSRSPDAFIGDTYGTVISRLRRTPEPTVITPDGQPCNGTTRGVVHPAPTIVTGIATIGREARRWRDHTSIHGTPDHITYRQPDTWPQHLATLRRIAKRVGQVATAKEVGISERTLRNLLQCRPPSPRTEARVIDWLDRDRRRRPLLGFLHG